MRFRDYLEWLHGATRMHLKTACTHDDILDEQIVDKDNAFDNETRVDFQIEHAPVADRVVNIDNAFYVPSSLDPFP
jgi:hypothetical protein